MARIAKALETLRRQVDEIYPQRSKVSDGWLGDAAHQARKSDHNPNSAGVVQALDITHDPRPNVGPDTWKLAEILRINRDPRIKYVISNGRIFSSTVAPWTWRAYNGANRHDKHIHVSVSDDAGRYDDPAEWQLTVGEDMAPRPAEPDAMRAAMAAHIIEYEDGGARLKISHLEDGTIEVAGVNSRFHAPEAEALKTLVEAGKDAEARQRAGEYILRYTDAVREWTKNPGIEFYLRDTFFNRGPTGAAIVLQKAVGVAQDGRVGPQTREALKAQEIAPKGLLASLRAAREQYEIEKYGKREHLWKGLTNRWNNAESTALLLMDPDPQPAPQPQPQPMPDPTPQPIPPPVPLPSVGTFIENIERITAQITAEKDEVAHAFARLKQLSEELAALTSRGV